MSFWCIALPLGYVLASFFQFGARGYWWSMVISAGLSVVLLQWRFGTKIKHYSKHITHDEQLHLLNTHV